MSRSTLTLDEATQPCWDAIVVGAGPAGALAAYELARRGVAVLLIEQAALPRPKPCGGCVNAAALEILKRVDDTALRELLQRNAQPLHQLRIAWGNAQATLSIPPAVALSRERLDHQLAEAAVAAGAQLCVRTHAIQSTAADETRTILVHQMGRTAALTARVIVAATGLAPRWLSSEPGISLHVETRSRIGFGAIANDRSDQYHPETVTLACGRGGYVGLARVTDSTLAIAAACVPMFIRQSGGPAAAVSRLLDSCRLPIPRDLDTVPWHGTARLTCRATPPAAHRLLLVGDSAGYIEPFTGEGIAWALASGQAVVDIAQDAIADWHPWLIQRWATRHDTIIGRRGTLARWMRHALNHPRLSRGLIQILSRVPSLANPLITAVNATYAVP